MYWGVLRDGYVDDDLVDDETRAEIEVVQSKTQQLKGHDESNARCSLASD